MAISGITITSFRDEVIDYLYPHWEASSAVILRLQSFKWMYFMKAFTTNTWLVILLTPVLMTCVLLVFKWINDHIFGPEYAYVVLDGGRMVHVPVRIATASNAVRHGRMPCVDPCNIVACRVDSCACEAGTAVDSSSDISTQADTVSRSDTTNPSHRSNTLPPIYGVIHTLQGYFFILLGGIVLQGKFNIYILTLHTMPFSQVVVFCYNLSIFKLNRYRVIISCTLPNVYTYHSECLFIYRHIDCQ